MKKRITLAAMTLLTLMASAQLKNVKGYLPEGMTDWIRLETDNINLRKEPSASAPRLMYKISDEGEFGPPEYTWGQKQTATLQPEQGYKGEICPMVDRNHNYNPRYDDIPEDAELWVKVDVFPGGSTESFPVWVKQEFCYRMPFTSLEADKYYINSYQKYSLHIRRGGQYDGLCLFQANLNDGDLTIDGLFVGKLIEGVVVLPLRFNGYLTEIAEAKGVEFGKNFRGNTYMGYPPYYVMDADGPGIGALLPDLSRLTDKDITELLKHCEDHSNYEILLFSNPFEGGYMPYIVATEPGLGYQRWWGSFMLKEVTFDLGKAANPRIINNPSLSYLNPGAKLERVRIEPEGTTLEMSFINSAGLRQWNVNCYAYITCDATPGKQYKLLRTRGVNISPKPTNLSGNRNERVSFSMTFEPIPLSATKLTLVEGPSKDNFHAENVNIAE